MNKLPLFLPGVDGFAKSLLQYGHCNPYSIMWMVVLALCWPFNTFKSKPSVGSKTARQQPTYQFHHIVYLDYHCRS